MSQATGPHHVLREDTSTVEPWKALLNGGSSVAVTNETHAKIHRGELFSGGKLGATLAAATKAYLICNNTHGTKSLHVTAKFSGSVEAGVRVYLGATGKAAGALAPSYNRLTGVADTDVAVWWGSTPTGGAVAEEEYLPGGGGPFAQGGTEFLEEWVVAAGEWIVFEAENLSASTMDHYSFGWRFYLPAIP